MSLQVRPSGNLYFVVAGVVSLVSAYTRAASKSRKVYTRQVFGNQYLGGEGRGGGGGGGGGGRGGRGGGF